MSTHDEAMRLADALMQHRVPEGLIDDAAAMLRQQAAEIEQWRAMLKLRHDNAGECPDEHQPNARSRHCLACRAMVELGA